MNSNLPTINVIQNLVGALFAMHDHEIFLDPVDKMVFEHAFDELVKEIWCEKNVPMDG